MIDTDIKPSLSVSAHRPRRTAMQASVIVRSFLDAMENRDLELAFNHLSPDFRMTFPGNIQFTELEELVAWGKTRYRSISKSYTRFDESTDGEDAIVYCFGTLSGTLPDDTSFERIRFIDRFTIRDGKLLDQQVWNDMGETISSG